MVYNLLSKSRLGKFKNTRRLRVKKSDKIVRTITGVVISLFIVTTFFAIYNSDNDSATSKVRTAHEEEMRNLLLTVNRGDFVETINGLNLILAVRKENKAAVYVVWLQSSETVDSWPYSVDELSEITTRIVRSIGPDSLLWNSLVRKFLTE